MTSQGKTGEQVRYKPGYDKVAPLSNYAPWSVDEGFKLIYRDIREHTMVDEYRCYQLWKLVEQAVQHEGDILEIGVWRGGTGALLARRAAATFHSPSRSGAGEAAPPYGWKPPRLPRVFLADTFRGVVKAGPLDEYYRGGEHANTNPEIVQALLSRLGIENAELLVGIFPEDTASRIADRVFSFCHIDVDVYQSARDCLEWVWPRLSVGGIVVYDDYGFYGCEGVTAHVNEMHPASDRVVIHNLSGQAVVVKVR